MTTKGQIDLSGLRQPGVNAGPAAPTSSVPVAPPNAVPSSDIKPEAAVLSPELDLHTLSVMLEDLR